MKISTLDQRLLVLECLSTRTMRLNEILIAAQNNIVCKEKTVGLFVALGKLIILITVRQGAILVYLTMIQ